MLLNITEEWLQILAKYDPSPLKNLLLRLRSNEINVIMVMPRFLVARRVLVVGFMSGGMVIGTMSEGIIISDEVVESANEFIVS